MIQQPHTSCGNGKHKLVQSLAACALVEAMTRAAIMIGHIYRRCAQAEDALGAQDPHCISISICTMQEVVEVAVVFRRVLGSRMLVHMPRKRWHPQEGLDVLRVRPLVLGPFGVPRAWHGECVPPTTGAPPPPPASRALAAAAVVVAAGRPLRPPL